MVEALTGCRLEPRLGAAIAAAAGAGRRARATHGGCGFGRAGTDTARAFRTRGGYDREWDGAARVGTELRWNEMGPAGGRTNRFHDCCTHSAVPDSQSHPPTKARTPTVSQKPPSHPNTDSHRHRPTHKGTDSHRLPPSHPQKRGLPPPPWSHRPTQERPATDSHRLPGANVPPTKDSQIPGFRVPGGILNSRNSRNSGVRQFRAHQKSGAI